MDKKEAIKKFLAEIPNAKEVWLKLKDQFNLIPAVVTQPVVNPIASPLATPVATFGEGKLKDGTVIQWEGDSLIEGVACSFVDPANPAGFLPIPDGDYELENGTRFSIKEGKATNVVAPAPTEPVVQNQPVVMADYAWEQCIADQTAKYGDKTTAEKVCAAIKNGSIGMKEHVKVVSDLIDMEIEMGKVKTEFATQKKESDKELTDIKANVEKMQKFMDAFLELPEVDPADDNKNVKKSKKDILIEKLNKQ